MTPGMKSSEFGVTVLVLAASLALALTGTVDGDSALTAITGAGAAYGLSRGIAKRPSAGE
jgi:hypothetical protein